MNIRIIQGDCIEELRKLSAETVDSCVTDPPYGLKFMGKLWDHGIPATPYWFEVLRVLKPGAYLLAFGGTRTYHRLACAIEDAGFEIRDQIGWAFGSGFPKSHNGAWGGTALKPAWEPIVMARKPFIGTVAANVEAHGTGALNIDGCRIRSNESTARPSGGMLGIMNDDNWQPDIGRITGGNDLGRWPANLIHDGSDEVLACFPDTSGGGKPLKRTRDESAVNFVAARPEYTPYADTTEGGGSVARFFYCAKASREDRNEGLRGCVKKPLNWSSGTQSPGTFQSQNTDRSAENHHPTVKPTDLMRYLCRLVTPKGGTVLDPFMGSGSTLKAAELEGFSAIGIEINPEYCEIARKRIGADAPLFVGMMG